MRKNVKERTKRILDALFLMHWQVYIYKKERERERDAEIVMYKFPMQKSLLVQNDIIIQSAEDHFSKVCLSFK